ncbi:class I SAM-dependent methyltransferase [Streptomyces canus]|uniref:class I SAM-dependent methyltransferase n=1 Tax=Streptomyces canus TaxID=58343 RepID=UPI002E2D811F|nr:class I SAM-dependent methyltransferase [Streptomyces canus]
MHIDTLRQFYLSHRPGEPTLFDIWEAGGARGDSVTPSTYSDAYRSWMHDKLVTAVKENRTDRLLSIGCGNAAVESEVAQGGYRVLAVDAIEDAVALARAKGIEAQCADVTTWSPDGSWPVVYADGLLGHIYQPATGLAPLLSRIREWLSNTDTRGTLIASNDGPKDGSRVQAAPGVPGFHWLSGEYMHDQAVAAGFQDVSVEYFRYDRPESGVRSRAVITAHTGT